MEKPSDDEQRNVEGTSASSSINNTQRPRNPIEELEMLAYLSDTEEEEDDDDDEEESEEDGSDEAEEVMNDDEANDGFAIASVDREIIMPTFEPKVSDNSIQATLSDPDVLDCYICSEPLTIPVFQCINGHIACSLCCAKLLYKCPFCSMRIDHSRCLAIEKVLVSLQIACQNATYGCNEILRYSQKYEHEKTCIYVPCSCLGCNFVAKSSDLYLHFKENHMNAKTSFKYDEFFSVLLSHDENIVVLQEQIDGKLFVLKNKASENQGNAVTIYHIGPNSPNPISYYEIKARSMVENKSVQFLASAQNIQGFTFGSASSSPRSLLIPLDFFNSHGRLVLEICINLYPIKLKEVHRC
ncbi:E3 ubiquitin-protein ligase SINA-like 7 [Gastrolobium bilobum]|uniref:E3 ubiquitin-protein ligase SINA-like 7 n=1 Tax=Gastrolobium bilobum TaxID=150636 RepID=UPI002AB2CB6B|nr:E3 ubiquitin-protein ligase SINA-like 7 [Gastrolobium bilobum]